MLSELKIGPAPISPDGIIAPARGCRSGEAGVSDVHARYQEATVRGSVYSINLLATTTGVAAGNIVGAGAAASTQFAIFNPVGSGKNVVLMKFFMGITSGTPGAGPLFHGVFTSVPTVASIGGTIRPNFVSTTQASASVVIPQVLAAGSALTGGTAPVVLRPSAFSSTNTAQASVGELSSLELLDGDIVLQPGTGYVPLWSAAGTALLNAYGLTWEEVPL